MKNKTTFLYGLGERKEYKNLFKYFNVPKIDWNRSTIIPTIGKVDTLVGFSMGAILACDYALKHKVKTLILCSMTTGVETLEKVKVDKIIFLIGEKEKWVIKDTKRVLKTVKNRAKIIVIPKANHKIDSKYLKKIRKVLSRI
jgi:alpha/beta superfamily hydrolase